MDKELYELHWVLKRLLSHKENLTVLESLLGANLNDDYIQIINLLEPKETDKLGDAHLLIINGKRAKVLVTLENKYSFFQLKQIIYSSSNLLSKNPSLERNFNTILGLSEISLVFQPIIDWKIEGRMEARTEIAKRCIDHNEPHADITRYTNLNETEINALKNNLFLATFKEKFVVATFSELSRK